MIFFFLRKKVHSSEGPSSESRQTWFKLQFCQLLVGLVGFPGSPSGKEPACQCRRLETRIPSLGQEDPLEEVMATHVNILAE